MSLVNRSQHYDYSEIKTGKSQVETEKINKLLKHIPMDKIIDLNEVI